MDVDTMPAGLDLDRLIAMKVMTLSAVKVDLFKGSDGRFWYLGDPSNRPRTPHTDFRPSSDIAAAWLVVEEMRRERAGITERLFWRFEDMCDRWQVEILVEHYNGGELKALAYGETAPLAICRAALKAVGVRDG